MGAIWLVCGSAAILGLVVTACTSDQPPPPPLEFSGVPASGSLALATRSGFTSCFNVDAIRIRCRKHRVLFLGQGPYQAAIDLKGSKGQSGFDHVVLWHDEDQRALYDVLVPLYRQGWRACITGTERAGDQAIFTLAGAPVWISVDISYYGKRRLRIFPKTIAPKLSSACIPQAGLEVFNLNV
jgi:hypothetical protein